ncbi:MAG: glycosyl hydrolase [Acidobacteria bacterium]|nr:glycosyl hydrolase [Acidobacteriota bacterium]
MPNRSIARLLPVLVLVIALTGSTARSAAGQEGGITASASTADQVSLDGMRYRSVGPYRGGRVTAVDGVPGEPFTYFHGTTGGGVWRTDNAGHTWGNVTDGFLDVGPVGAVEVSAADPNVIYVGTGSTCVRGNVSIGRGMYRSTDKGETWSFIGLPNAGQIGRVLTHPDDADLVYAAVLGNPFGPSEERGVYRSRDGGANWELVHFVGAETGAVELAMNPANPRILYAAMWRAERKPWSMISGSEDGGLFRSKDGGDTWERLEGGFPQGLVGRIGVAVSPADPSRVWAIVEADRDRSAVYRSDDGGDTWSKASTQGRLVSRPWYYMHVEPHPTDRNTVFVLNSGFFKSIDGGETFESISMPHSDHHDLWIAPHNPDVMLMGNDGGATVSLDGGETWSPQFNQPTAEFYSVTVDNGFPYRIYGPQQDNSTISVPSMASYSGISMQHWRAVGGCETGPIAINPANPEIFYAGCFGGRLARFDQSTEQFRQIRDYPENMAGMPESSLRYRIQWNAPITTSRHDPEVLYHGSQYVHRTRNEGQSWEVISPDLTGNHTEMFGPAGGPITNDITGVEIYSALLAIEEDVLDAATIWTGSNDGVVSISRDGGDTWANVTPPGLPDISTVNRIEPSAHQAGKAYVAAYRYRVNDWAPYIFVTEDFGASWMRIADGTRGIPADSPVRVVREDPEREGLLYAGTEFGLYASFDDGDSWRSLQLNLPISPVTDLRVHFGDLVVATQGRSFWVLDDLSPLQQMAASPDLASPRLFAPRAAYRTSATTSDRNYDRDRVFGAMMPRDWLGENPPDGATIYYMLGADTEAVEIEVLDASGDSVRKFESTNRRDGVTTTAGVNRFVWNLAYEGVDLGGPFSPSGPRAVPGTYRVRLTVGENVQEQEFEVRKDPRLTYITVEDLQEQFDFLQRGWGEMKRLQGGRRQITAIRDQLDALEARLETVERVADFEEDLAAVRERLTEIEGLLTNTEGGGWESEPQIQGHLSWVLTAASSQRGMRTDARPTDQLVLRLDDLTTELDGQLAGLRALVDGEVASLSARLEEMGLPAVVTKSPAG